MWRLLVFFLFAVAIMAGILFSPLNAIAESGAWITNPVNRLSEVRSQGTPSEAKFCGGRLNVVDIKGDTVQRTACIFGEPGGSRLARYRASSNHFAYAVSLGVSHAFVPVRGLCEGLLYCAYATGDTLLFQSPLSGEYTYEFIKNFTSHLVGKDGFYEFDYKGEYPLLTNEGRPIQVGAFAVSMNGKWVLINSKDTGLIVLDVASLTYKRIAPVDPHALINQDPIELAITDDGKLATVVGYISGPIIYEISGSCGEILQPGYAQPPPGNVQACRSRTINLNSVATGIQSAHTPRFTTDNSRLILETEKAGLFYNMVLTADSNRSGNPFYVAFGDSYTSGEGESSDTFYINGTNSLTNKCHVSLRSYPYLLEHAWDISALNLACSGSVVSGVREASQGYLKGIHLDWPSIVSLGVGGNDIGFMGKLKACIGVGTCEWAKADKRKATAQEIKAYFTKLTDFIAELKADFLPATMFIVGYPNIINDSASASCSLVISSILDSEERRYMSESIKYLNQVMRAAANYSKVTFVDIESAFEGERLCDEKDSAMNAIRAGDDIAPIPLLPDIKMIGSESFHPTARGHSLTAARISNQLEALWAVPACQNCGYSASQLEPSSYWGGPSNNETTLLMQVAQNFLKVESIENITRVTFKFLSNIFEPNSTVRFELHSDVKQLGIFRARGDGSLEGELRMPPGVEGYHTVHAYGKSHSGDDIDVYEVAYVNTAGMIEESVVATLSAGGKSELPVTNLVTGPSLSSDILGVSTGNRPLVYDDAAIHPQRNVHIENIITWALSTVGIITTIIIFIYKMRQKLAKPGK